MVSGSGRVGVSAHRGGTVSGSGRLGVSALCGGTILGGCIGAVLFFFFFFFFFFKHVFPFSYELQFLTTDQCHNDL